MQHKYQLNQSAFIFSVIAVTIQSLFFSVIACDDGDGCYHLLTCMFLETAMACWKWISCVFSDVSPRPLSRERERRTSTRLHQGIPTSTDMPREATHMSFGQAQGSILSGLTPAVSGRRGSASREDVSRSGSSKHVRNK